MNLIEHSTWWAESYSPDHNISTIFYDLNLHYLAHMTPHCSSLNQSPHPFINLRLI